MQIRLTKLKFKDLYNLIKELYRRTIQHEKLGGSRTGEERR